MSNRNFFLLVLSHYLLPLSPCLEIFFAVIHFKGQKILQDQQCGAKYKCVLGKGYMFLLRPAIFTLIRTSNSSLEVPM